MTGFYEEMAQTAKELLAEFGFDGDTAQGLPHRRTVNGKFDKVAGGYTSFQTEEQTLTAIQVPMNQTLADQLDIKHDGQTLKVTEVVMLKVAAHGLKFAPEPGQIVELDGKEMPIVSCTPVNPAGTPILYTIALKK
jgi:hypothetical protein